MSALKNLLGSPWLTTAMARAAGGPAVVLCYHDISGDGDPESWLSVPRGAFDAQLGLLRRLGTIVAADALLEPGPARLRFVLTFDDGKASSHHLAWPLLRAHGAPALFCVCSEHLDTGAPFWFDRMVAPIQLAHLAAVDLREHGIGRYALPAGPPATRWDAIQRILEDVKRSTPETSDRMEAILGTIAAQAGADPTAVRRALVPLTWDEAARMAGDPLVSFGSHSHRHTILTRLDGGELARDLLLSRERIATRLGREARWLAYPNGEHDAAVRTAARAAGFAGAFKVGGGVPRPGGDLFAVPRVLIGGYDSLALVGFKINRALARR